MLSTTLGWILAFAATLPTPAATRAAAERAIPLLVKSAAGHIEKQTCFACHNQTLPMLAVVAARNRGLTARADLKEQTDFIADFFGRNKEKFLKGEGTGGQADTAGYALLALDIGGHKPDEVTAAMVEFLLKYQADQDHWRVSSKRPPSEASDFTTNYLALRGLNVYGPAERKEAIAKRVAAVRGWLQKTKAKDTEDRAFRLLALREAGAPSDEIEEAAKTLAESQKKDGGWSQLDVADSDAYATGLALVAMHQAGGLSTTDPAYTRGLAFLLRTQAADGTWFVKSRSEPFQPYYETGFPYAKNQFISAAASGWAATALALACPTPADAPKRLLVRN